MTAREEDFAQWLGELVDVLISGYGYVETDAQRYVLNQPEVWRDFFDDGYTPRQTAAEDTAAGL